MTKNRTPTPVYLDPGIYPGLEVKGLMYSTYTCITSEFEQGVFHTTACRRWPPSMTVGSEPGVDKATKLKTTSRMGFNAAFVVLRMDTTSKREWAKLILNIVSQVIAGVKNSKNPVEHLLLIDNQLLIPSLMSDPPADHFFLCGGF